MGVFSRSIDRLRSLASPNSIKGHLGSCEGRIVAGWALDPTNPASPVTVSIYADAVLLGTAVADRFREDLQSAGIGEGHGRYGFAFYIPPSFRPSRPFQLSVSVEGRNALPGSPFTIERLADDSVTGHLDGANDGVVSGWAYILHDPTREITVVVEHEGHPLGAVPARAFREDLRLARAGAGTGQHGFVLPIPPEIRALKTYTLTARVEGGPYEDGPFLEGSPMTITENLDQPLRATGAAARTYLGSQYFQGQGIEIGALSDPMRIPPGCTVRYADAFTSQQLRQQYQVAAQGYEIVEVDIITDAHLLTEIENASQDFVIANHVIEHLGDPLLALRNMLRVLRPDGVLFFALPDKRHTFDKDRPCTPFEHLLEDHRHGPELSREAHYREWFRLVDKIPEHEIEARVRALMVKHDYGIHLHVWSQFEILELIHRAREVVPFPYELECFKANGAECISVLRRLPD
ncbi:MAG: methyltransferase domain-containing protein [Bryobacterales bacterium]|nr:methyltransferase domain-containing protein [Bryobacterales bacterium]